VARKIARVADELEQVGVPDALHGTLFGLQEHPARARQEYANASIRAVPVRAKDGERVMMPRLDQPDSIGIARGEAVSSSVGSDR
jgi:hypothetical protein